MIFESVKREGQEILGGQDGRASEARVKDLRVDIPVGRVVRGACWCTVAIEYRTRSM